MTADAAEFDTAAVVVGTGGRTLPPLTVPSVLVVGQNPPLAFFFAAYVPASPFEVILEAGLGCMVVDVEEDEFDDDNDEEEFVLCTLFF